MKKLAQLLVPILILGWPSLAAADDGDGRRGYREFKQEFWDGNCKVKREGKKDGEYKEERECKGGRQHARYDGREFKQEYWDGNCKVKRESKKDGEYKEERECKGARRQARDDSRYDPRHDPRGDADGETRVYYPAEPVYRAPEPGVRVDVRVR